MSKSSFFGLRTLTYALLRGAQRRKLQQRRVSGSIEASEERVLLSSTTTIYTNDDHGVLSDGSEWHKSDWASPEMLATFEDMTANGPFPESETFRLHSKPGSNYTIYMDFDGQVVTGTPWNTSSNNPTINARPYDLDGDPTTFNSQEHDVIQRVWLMVAEDFAPFDVNVTTEEPPVEDLIKSGPNDSRYGIRVIQTVDDFLNSGAGGIAYIGSFNWNTDTPAWVFNRGVGAMAETFSHEVGHAVFLSHDGLNTNNVTYYSGHSTGPTSWGAIMGAPFSKIVTQWDQGEYFDANNNTASANYNNGPDDLRVITTLNGFGYRTDDHGSSTGGATFLNPNGETDIDMLGIIERNDDLDFFRFETGDGPVSFNIQGPAERNNLDIWAGIYDSNGNLVAESNLFDNLSASFDNVVLTSGVYYLKIDGIGSHGVYNPSTDSVEDPTTNIPWQQANPVGYSQYASIGQYQITGTVTASRLDYGDAPDTYGTTKANNGAAHILAGVTLGALRDFESDGQPRANADGDDRLGDDDEDGVTFLNFLVPDRTTNLTVNAPMGGFLDAWIDFDGDGTFSASEHIFNDVNLTAGDNSLSFLVPATASTGTTYARFRIADSAAHVTSPTGKADSGEVEDYQVEISPLQLISEVLFDPAGADTGNEYIELRGEAGTTIADGTYFIAVNGDNASGNVEFVYNLSGLAYGANGYLLLAQNGNPYAGLVDPQSTLVESTGTGWRGGTRVAFLNPSDNDLDNSSTTFLLVQAMSAPRTGTDIDTNGDGTPDSGAFQQWTVLDSVAVTANGGDAGYSQLVYAANGTPLTPAGSAVINVGGTPLDYLGRQLASTGQGSSAWIGAIIDSNFSAPNSRLAAAAPPTFANRPLDHLGAINFLQYDFGDAPDSYNTSLVNNGARHAPNGPFLGVARDVESKATPNAFAVGDDLNGIDDEDGVVLPQLKEGTAGNISINVSNVSGSAVVQGWFDWNGDGDFGDLGEQAVNLTVTKSGVVVVPVGAPIGSFDATNGKTFARFRVSSGGTLSWAGQAPNGEVEDYPVTILTSATDDFGDAPSSYGVASHLLGGPRLGVERDIERSSNFSSDASGDDSHRIDDEDGIRFDSAITPGRTSLLNVHAPDGGVLDAWLDSNLNGKFDVGEQVITNVTLSKGDNAVNFTTPTGASLGTTILRFRIANSAGDVTGPTGRALNGEVEDYQVTIQSIFNRPPAVTDQSFSLQENSAVGTVVGTAIASDPDVGQSLTYRIASGNLNGAFSIDPVTGVLRVANKSAIDFEFIPEFRLKVRATDNGNPALSGDGYVTISITDHPTPDGNTFAVAEGSPSGTVVGRVPLNVLDQSQPLMYEILSGNVGEAFSIDGTGTVRVDNARSVDFERTPIFDLQIRATDPANPNNPETIALQIKVIDRNERAQIVDQDFLLPPNPVVGQAVGRVQATDPEGQPLEFEIFGGNESGAFSIDRLSGWVRVANPGAIDYGELGEVRLSVLVRDSGEPQFVSDAVVSIHPKVGVYSQDFAGSTALPAEFINPTAGVNVATIGGDNVLRLSQTGAAPTSNSVILNLDITGYDTLELSMIRRVLGSQTTGKVELSNDNGANWILLNTFNGSSSTARRVDLGLSRSAENLGILLRGTIQIRITVDTVALNAGAEFDNFELCGSDFGQRSEDVFLFDSSSGQWVLGRNDNTQFLDTTTSGWPNSSDWDFVQGDFNGDGRTDVAGFNANKEWYVGISDSDSLTISSSPWLSLQSHPDGKFNGSTTWSEFHAGDFNGDGRTDVIARANDGTWWIGRSTGTSFELMWGGSWAATGWHRFVVGDFNGDGMDDIAGNYDSPQNGSIQADPWFVGHGTASPDRAIMPPRASGSWSPSLGWHTVLVGDFNGDGTDDLAARNQFGAWWIGYSSSNTFSFQYAVRWATTYNWQSILVGDFNGDGRDDLLGRRDNGAMWLSQSLGSSMQLVFMGTTASGPETMSVAGDFNEDGADDVATFDAATGNWVASLTGFGPRLRNFAYGTWSTNLEVDYIGTGLLG
ncbi:MAG: cadherin domain-containing protein [Planctomycetaceae bacterium]|nr:cadherin domain-containing protein [Planctomycetaceae bacterium]